MKIRSLSELNDFLAKELAWRKRELTTFIFLVQCPREHQQNAILRGAICILYAHWEGFIKAAATSYLRLVASQGLKYRDLSANFVALGLGPKIKIAGLSNKVSLHTELVEYLLSDLNDSANIPYDNAFDTIGNLNSKVLQDILCALGLDDKFYLTKGPLIDEKLLHNRNNVAHGEYFDIEQADYENLHEEVIKLVEQFRTDIENKAILQGYLRS